MEVLIWRKLCEEMALSPGTFGGGLVWLLWLVGQLAILGVSGDNCRITPVLHTLQYPGCVSVNVPSFSCVGKCTSYVQVSGAKIWQMERSCMCCQESGVREATVTLTCPKAPPGSPKVRKITTKAPVDCMCRPCTSVEEGLILPQEMAGFVDDDGPPLSLMPFRMQLTL